MTTTQPKYSILIPTRNKCEFIGYAIRSILEQPFSNIEIIISDNHSSDGTAEYLAKLEDPRLRITQPPHPLPMAMHYEYLLSLAKGDWVTILGDDDAVMPYFFERLEEITAKFKEIDIIASRRAYFFWEGCQDYYGNLVVSYRSDETKKICSTKYHLFLALAGLRSCFDLPQVYTTCVVRRQLVTDIKDRSGGHFYHSIIPDMYSVVALSLQSNKYLRLGEPLFWVGTSNKSMGRSDRIYRDSETILPDELGSGWRNLSLSKKIPEKLHAGKFSPLYLYECILQHPFSSKLFKGRFVGIVVYAVVLMSLQRRALTRNHRSGAELKLCLKEQVSQNELSYSIVRFLALLLHCLSIVRFGSLLLERAHFELMKLFRVTGKCSLVSSSRKMFPDVMVASRAILNLRKR